MTQITADTLAARLDDADLTIVDARPLVAYNGWRQGDDARGGHVPGAVAFPIEWLGTVDGPEIDRLLAEKRITPDRAVVVYGATASDAERFAAALRTRGHDDVSTLDGGFTAWAADLARPVDKLLRHDRLVHVAQCLRKRLRLWSGRHAASHLDVPRSRRCRQPRHLLRLQH